MSEESRNPEREISEAELTNVSGGSGGCSNNATESEVSQFLCKYCPGKQMPKKCSGSAAQVVAYLREHANVIIHNAADCPFFKY